MPKPEYQIGFDEVKLIFRFKETMLAVGQVAGQVEFLIKCLADETLSVKGMMERLLLKGRDNFLNTYLKKKYPSFRICYHEWSEDCKR